VVRVAPGRYQEGCCKGLAAYINCHIVFPVEELYLFIR
jgi:hypothetical protein